MAPNRAECLVGGDYTQEDHKSFGPPAIVISRDTQDAFEDFGPFAWFDTRRRPYVALPTGSHATEHAMVDVFVYSPPKASGLGALLNGVFPRIYAALRWIGLLTLEVILTPFLGQKPMKNSVMTPMAEWLVHRWQKHR